MSRRRSSKQDSLELLLDTICNTFGGVLFIAILVVLLLQQTGVGPANETSVSVPVSPVEMQLLTTRMEVVNDDLSRLRQNRDSQDAIVQTFAPESIRQLLAKRSEVVGKQERLQTDVDQLLADHAGIVVRVERLEVENASVRPQLDESQAKLRNIQAQLEQDRQSRVEEIRLPVIRTSIKAEIGLILRYGRMYVWHKYDDRHVRLGLNTDDFVVIGENGGGLVTRPKPTAGIALDDTEASRSAIRRVLLRFDPRSSYLVVVARPDSFGVFRYLRDAALDLGFEYRLMPDSEDSPVSDRGGTGGQVQ